MSLLVRPCCPITTDVGLAAATLRAGQLCAIATETVYGLGANALDEQAVARVFAAKNRPHFDPLIVHVVSEAWLQRLVSDFPPAARKLAAAFWPGPLTLVLPKTELVPDLVTSGLPSVAIRMPAHPQARELLRQVDLPIAAPSANPFGQLSPTTAQHVADSLGDKIDLILDGGPASVGVESTVVSAAGECVEILRHGGITQEQLEAALNAAVAARTSHSGAAPSPGMLSQHYSPTTPLIVTADWRSLAVERSRAGLMLLQPDDFSTDFAAVEVLTTDGDLTTAAARFFAALRRLDHCGLDVLIAAPFPEIGLGRALNDRLLRAAHQRTV